MQPRATSRRAAQAGVLVAVFAAVVFVTPAADVQQPGVTEAVPAGDVENGRQLFTRHGCYACHGYAGQSGPGGRLATTPRPFPEFVRYTRWPSGTMPAYRDHIPESDLADIYAFLESVPPPPDPRSIPLLAVD